MVLPSSPYARTSSRFSLTIPGFLCVLAPVAAAQFEADQRLDPGVAGMVESDGLEVAESSGLVHATWYEEDAVTGRDIWYTRSIDGGRTFEAARRLDLAAGAADAIGPVVLAEGSTVVVAWLDDRGAAGVDTVWARVSQDSGVSFGAERALGSSVAGDSDALVGAIELPYVHLAFESDGLANDPNGLIEDVWVLSSQDSGASFGSAQRANRPPGGGGTADVDDPSLAASGSDVFVAWVDRRSGTADEVRLNVSSNGGLSFPATDVRLNSAAGVGVDADDPRIFASFGDLIVTWRDDRGAPGTGANQLFMSASVDAGATFLGETRLDAAGAGASASSGKVAFNGRKFGVAWVDDRSAPGLADDVFLRAGSLAGDVLSLGAELRVESTPAGASDNGGVEIAYRDDLLYVQYQDSRLDPADQNDGLYLRVSVDEGRTFGAEILLTPTLSATEDVEGNELVVGAGGALVNFWGDDRNGTGLPRLNDLFASYGRFVQASASARNAGANPSSYDATPPVLGTTFTATVDLSTSGHAVAGLVGFASGITLPLLDGQVLLVNALDPGGELLALPLLPGPVATFGVPLPLDLDLAGLALSTQALHFGGVTPFALSNAQDVVLGTL